MSTWILLYLYNLRYPLIIITFLVLCVSVAIGIWSAKVRSRNSAISPIADAATWRQMVSFKASIGLALLCAAIWAIPSPEYNIRYIEKKIYTGAPKTVAHDSYKDLYDSCSGKFGRSEYTVQMMAMCHRIALDGSSDRPTVKIVKVKDSFKDLFNECNSNSVDGAGDGPNGAVKLRNERLAICTKMATEGSTVH